MARVMIFVHEVHEVAGGKMEEFGDAVRTRWRPLIEQGDHARLLWFWELAHGTGASYQAVSITAVRDWQTWGAIAARTDDTTRAWHRDVGALRREVTSKILFPATWSPFQEIDLATSPSRDGSGLYLHDTGWPFPGMLDDYLNALGTIFYPQVQHAKMISIAACWRVAPGTGKHHEVVLLQRIENWDAFAKLLSQGEQGHQRTGWMVEGLRFRDRWESKLLRCVPWSPMR